MNEQRTKIPRNVLILSFVALASGFGQDLISPILPAYLALLGFSHESIGLIDGLLQGATSLFRFVSGILSDRFANRKTFVFAGYTLSSIARPLLALFGSFGAIAALRTIDGVGKGMKDAPRDALVADSSRQEVYGRAFGFHRLVDTAGSVLGPLVASAILIDLTPSLSSYHLIFALAAVPGIIALLLISFGVREPEAKEKAKATSHKALGWKFWLFTAGTSIAMLTKINDSLFLIRSHEIGISAQLIPALFAGFTLVYAALSYPIGILSDRIGKMPLIAAGWLLLAFIELGFAYDTTISFALVLFAGYGLFYALTEGSGRALIADLIATESRGLAYGIFYTLTGLTIIAGGYGLGRIWDTYSFHAAFLISSLGSFIGFLVFAIVLFEHRNKSKSLT